MAVVKTSGNDDIRLYTCLTTDSKETWPTDCSAESIMTVVDATTEAVTAYYYFNGTIWCLL